MSMNRPEQYPEISDDESGLVPQESPRPEWPKKIRMLSAAELDRLTIDSDGRFYWDGKLVNYDLMQQQQFQQPDAQHNHQAATIDPADRNAFELLDRSAADFHAHNRNQLEPTVSAAPQVTAEPLHTPGVRAVDLDTVTQQPSLPQVSAPAAVVPAAYPTLTGTTMSATTAAKVRISLSAWQSIGLMLVILGFLAGMLGVAANGLVAANEWGCRLGMVKATYCPPPPPPPPAPPARPDIPA